MQNRSFNSTKTQKQHNTTNEVKYTYDDEMELLDFITLPTSLSKHIYTYKQNTHTQFYTVYFLLLFYLHADITHTYASAFNIMHF